MIARLRAVTSRGWARVGDGLLAGSVFAVALAAYARMAAPSVAALYDDSLEFPLVAQRLAIAHPTGYPLYTLLAALAAWLTRPNVAWGVNLLSAVAAAAAVALVYLLGRELTLGPQGARTRRLPALLGALALAASPVFWSQAVVAEVYALHAALVAACVWLALRWARQPLLPVTPPRHRRGGLFLPVEPAVAGQAPGRLFLAGERGWLRLAPQVRRATARAQLAYRRIWPPVAPHHRLRPHPLALAVAATLGLGLAHHRTIVLLIPPLLVFAFLVERRIFGRAALLGPEQPPWRGPRAWRIVTRPGVLLALCLLAPLLLYLYLPLRGHVGSLDGTYSHTLGGFLRWITASSYGVFLGDNPLAGKQGAGFYAELFWQQFGPLGLALAAVGVIGLARRPKRLALIGLSLAAYIAFSAVYRVPDVQVMLIPAFVLTAACIAAGLDWAADLLRPRGPQPAVRRLLWTARLLLFVAAAWQPLAIAARAYPDLDLSRRWAVHDYGRRVLEQPLPANSTIVGLGGETTLLRYLQETQGLRPDVVTVTANDEAARLEAVRSALAQGRTVYITRPLPGLDHDHSLGAAIGVVNVSGEPEALVRVDEIYYQPPAAPNPLDVKVAQGVRLAGYDVEEYAAHGQAWLRLRLWWRTPNGVAERLKVSARVAEAQGRIVAAVDAEPVANTYPTTAWRPGEVVADAYEIPLPAGLPPGTYTPVVVIYVQEGGAVTERGRSELPPLSLRGSPERPARRVVEASLGHTSYARVGDVELLGWTAPDAAGAYRPGTPLPLTLLWQARQPPDGAFELHFVLEGEGRSLPLAAAPLGGDYDSGRWAEGQLVRQWPPLVVPPEAPPGDYRLTMRLLRDGRPLAWGRWLLPLGSDFILGSVRVE